MDSFEIRRLTLDEALDVAKLEAASFTHPWPLEEVRYELKENPCAAVLGLYFDGELRGYIDFMITFDSATISRLAVYPKDRRKGYAEALIKEMHRICLSSSDKIEWITLEVRSSNEAARSLYEKMGYEKITVKPKYYTDGEDAIYMMRSLL